MAARMASRKVELRGCHATLSDSQGRAPATEQDWDTEYLELILSVKMVDSIDEAIEFIGAPWFGPGRCHCYQETDGGGAL